MKFFEDAKPQHATIVRAPESLKFFYDATPLVFLAGSIEQGTAEKWQQETINFLKNENVIILDPRRDDWDTSIENNETALLEQVTWELTGLEEADVVLMHFDPTTKSPISLFELGMLISGENPVVISCSPEFYRYGNIKITCDRYNIPVYHTLKEAQKELKLILHDMVKD